MSVLALVSGDHFASAVAAPRVRPTAAPVVRRRVEPGAELSAEVRAKRDERWLYCKLVFAAVRSGIPGEQAAALVAARDAERFPILVSGGKGGRTALTYNNYRNWMLLLGKKSGETNWDNIDALADNYARGKREAKGDADFWQWFHSFFLNQNKLSLNEAYRLAATRIRKDNAFARIPSLRQVRYQALRLDPAAVALARHGEEYLKNHYLGFNNRDWDDVYVDEVWIADHRVFDFWVRVFNEAKGEWEATRPCLCGFMDGKSWYLVSWQLVVDSPNSALIQKGLALGIVNNGMRRPEKLYTDRGSDFLCQGFSEPVEFEGKKFSILNELGIQTITSLPYRGRSKTIERCFREMATRFDKYFAAYLGNTPGARPEISGFFAKNVELLPTLEQVSEAFAGWLELYHGTPNNGKILGGKTPREVWTNAPRDRAPISPVALAAAMLFPLAQSRTVHRGPAVSVDKVEFYGECLWPYFDKKVMVKLDQFDAERVFVFELSGRPIGECKTRAAVKALAKTTEERAAVAEGMKIERRQLRRAYNVLDAATGGLHRLTAEGLLRLGSLDAEIEKIGAKKSVKGASHLTAFYAPKETAALPATPEGPGPDVEAEETALSPDVEQEAEGRDYPGIEFKEDAAIAKARAIHEFLTTTYKRERDDYAE